MKRVLNLLLASLILTTPDFAPAQELPSRQSETGTIRGTVLDPHGAVIPGAEVRATNNRTGEPFLTKSNDEGMFALTGLPFGDYSLLIEARGFAKFNTQVALSREASTSAHNAAVTLAVGEFRIDAHMIEVGSGATVCIVCGYTYFSISYADLPLIDRDPQRLLALQAGVTEHKGRFSIAGRRAENKTAQLDGFDNRDPATGRFTASLSLDSLSEFNSDYTNADTTVNSSYGQNSAPLLAAVSRAGTNEYHGAGLWHLQRTGLGANGFFTNRGGLPRDQAMFDRAAFTLSGNISVPALFSGKERAFFFISYEGTRDHETTGRQIIAPLASFVERTAEVQGTLFRSSLLENRIQLASGSGLQDVDGDGLNDVGDAVVRSSSSLARMLALARVDLRLTDSLQLNLRYFRDRSRGLDDFNDGAFTPASPLSATGKGDLAGLQFTAVINPSTVNEFRFGYLKGQTDLTGAGSDAPQLVAVNTPLSVGGGLPELPEQHENRAFIFADTFTRAAGAHSLSTGAQVIRRNEHYTSGGLGRGRIYYADALALLTDGALSGGDPLRSVVRAELQGSSETELYQFTDLYAFANDNWRAGPRFVLNYGSAYNIYSGAIYERKTDRNNFAPFASFAFAPTHSESIILRGGAAIIYAPPTRLAYGEIKATPLYPVASGFARPNEITGFPLPRAWAERDGAIEIEQEYAPDLRTAYTESAFLFVQRAMRDRLIVEAGYNSTFGHRLTRAYRTNRDSLHSSIGGSAAHSSNEETILIASDGNSSYHSFQFRVTSRERRRLTFQAHYTLSKSIDTASDETPSMFRSLVLGPVAEGNAALERGPSDFDRRHRAVGFFLWRGPEFNRAGNHLRWVLGGWQSSGIVTMQSGPRVSLYSSGDFYGGRGDFNRDGVLNDRLAYSGGGSSQGSDRKRGNAADGYFDTSRFGAPGVNGRESLDRNVLLAPGYASLDLSIQKRFPLSEDHRIEVRADVFNLTNRVNFAPPVTDFVSANFGRSVEAGRARIVRLALKYSF
jgi:carboxypeptidase family protein